MTPASVLPSALQTGVIDPLAERYADDATLDAGLPGGRVSATGRPEIARRLGEWYAGPGRLVEWSAVEHPRGAAIWLERSGEQGVVRQRHYLRSHAGLILRHWIYGAPPRTAAPDLTPAAATPPPAFLARRGRVTEVRPIVSSGWSGDAIAAVTMADGRDAGPSGGGPLVDLMHCAWRIEATRDEIVEDFSRVRGEADDPQALEVGLLTGLVQYGWILGHSAAVHPDPAERAWAHEELAWWLPRARSALAAWSPGRPLASGGT